MPATATMSVWPWSIAVTRGLTAGTCLMSSIVVRGYLGAQWPADAMGGSGYAWASKSIRPMTFGYGQRGLREAGRDMEGALGMAGRGWGVGGQGVRTICHLSVTISQVGSVDREASPRAQIYPTPFGRDINYTAPTRSNHRAAATVHPRSPASAPQHKQTWALWAP